MYKNLNNRVQNKNNARFNFVLIDNIYCFQLKFRIYLKFIKDMFLLKKKMFIIL